MALVVHGFGTVKNVQKRTFGSDGVAFKAEIESFDGTVLEFDANGFDPTEHDGKVVFFSGRYEKVNYTKKSTGEPGVFNALRLMSLKEPTSIEPNTPVGQPQVSAPDLDDGGFDDSTIPF